MAAVIPARSALSQQKLKRPPLPAVQTTINGAKSLHSSPSPSLGSKRPPSGFKHPPAASTVNGANGPINGTASRSSVRRKDSQKPGDMSARQARSAKGGPGDGLHIDKRATKRMPEPYGRSLCASRLCLLFSSADLPRNDSQDHILHVEEVPQGISLAHTTSTPYPFQIRPARWNVFIQLCHEGSPGAHQVSNCTS